MKKVLAIAAAMAAFTAPQAFAQASQFEGFSLGANLEFDNASSSASDGTSDGANNTAASVQARYDWALGHNFVLGLGATMNTGNRKAGTYANGAGAYLNNRYSLDVMPGYVLGKDLLLYGKVSSVAATATADDGATSTSLQGLSYGIGLRGMMNRNLYWQAGIDTYRFNDASFATGTTASLKGSVVGLGMGYKF